MLRKFAKKETLTGPGTRTKVFSFPQKFLFSYSTHFFELFLCL